MPARCRATASAGWLIPRSSERGEDAPESSTRASSLPHSMAAELQPFLIWDSKQHRPVPITRDDMGPGFVKKGLTPDLHANQKIKLKDGSEVEVRTHFCAS